MSNLFSGALPTGIGARTRLGTIAGGASVRDEDRKFLAWNNVPSVPGQQYKTDCDGRLIAFEEYGRYSEYGWHIDHIIPLVLNGPDVPANWRARHWKGNTEAGGRLSRLSQLF
jgi:hypothetical protein